MLKKLSYIYSTTDRTALMSHLKDKGKKQPKKWTLLHSEVCDANELKFDVKPLLKKLAKKNGFSMDQFRIDIVSNPNEESALDKGQFRVRYRYGIARDHVGEQLIKENTREFCSALVRAKKIYRREDISIMSFRGANPIAKRNYSIFNLKGHWNCRHAWIREVFVIERDPSETENNQITEKTTLSTMKKEVSEALSKFSKSIEGVELSKEDLVEINKALLSKQKFEDVKIDDKILRIDGAMAEGSAVNWLGEDGELSDVPNGEITIEDAKKVLKIEDGKIAEVKDMEEEGDGDEGGEGTPEALSAEAVSAIVTEALSAALKPINEKFTSIEKTIDKTPAFKGKGTKNSFKADEKNDDEPKDEKKSRPNVNSKFSIPSKKED